MKALFGFSGSKPTHFKEIFWQIENTRETVFWFLIQTNKKHMEFLFDLIIALV